MRDSAISLSSAATEARLHPNTGLFRSNNYPTALTLIGPGEGLSPTTLLYRWVKKINQSFPVWQSEVTLCTHAMSFPFQHQPSVIGPTSPAGAQTFSNVLLIVINGNVKRLKYLVNWIGDCILATARKQQTHSLTVIATAFSLAIKYKK